MGSSRIEFEEVDSEVVLSLTLSVRHLHLYAKQIHLIESTTLLHQPSHKLPIPLIVQSTLPIRKAHALSQELHKHFNDIISSVVEQHPGFRYDEAFVGT